MIFLRARFYNPADGRFQSRDTWKGDINNPITLNRWAYANANPIRYTDPSGNSVTQSIISTTLRRAGIGGASGGGNGYGIECASTGDAALGDFWLGFWKEAYRVHIWFNPVPSVREDVAIKSNESTSMLLGRLTADIVSIAIGGVEQNAAHLLFLAGPAECVAGVLAGGVGEFVTCPGAAVQMAGAAILAGQAVVSGAIAVAGGVQVLAILSGRSGGGGSNRGNETEIQNSLKRVKDRYDDWVQNRRGLRDAGHRKAYRQAQDSLRNALQKWYNKNYGPLPGDLQDAPNWVDKPLP